MELKNLPDLPGIYIMKNSDNDVIYVGKAKNIRKRVSSYFSKSAKDPKTKILVRHIETIDFIVTESEVEALILECNLIKEKKPKYNINLKDNKTYPFIKITVNEPYPRVFKTRHFKRDGGRYFGPYPNVGVVYRYLKLVQQLFPIRSCDLTLPSKSKVEPCLDYFIQRCDGCCIDKIAPEDYKKYIDQVILFLKGKYNKLIRELTSKMKKAAEELKYETANTIKGQIQTVKEINEKQRVYAIEDCDVDVIGIFKGDSIFVATLLFIREGKLLGKRTFAIKEKDYLNGSFQSNILLTEIIKNYYNDDNELPKEVILPETPNELELLTGFLTKLKGEKVTITIPKLGKKIDWIQLASQNAEFRYLSEVKMTQKELVLTDLKKALNLSKEPRRIEGFDIANTEGRQSVAALVSFHNGVADKKNYRYYKIKSVEGPNDVASIKEAVGRRYQKIKNESLTFPDLILIDGGKGQVNGAKEVLDALNISVPVIGLAKREEEIFSPRNKVPLVLAKNSSALRLLQEIRDEAHRFGNSAHRKMRRKTMIKSSLEDIPGIGKVRRRILMNHFKSLDNIKTASLDDLLTVEKIDAKTAQQVYSHFHDKRKLKK